MVERMRLSACSDSAAGEGLFLVPEEVAMVAKSEDNSGNEMRTAYRLAQELLKDRLEMVDKTPISKSRR
ncbi:hypothetical protein EMGBD1_18930 [Anaerolineaceae bacterium]|nr:hypothetical protein EMGBD1_18930 [Anaerolineaceae bacterium]